MVTVILQISIPFGMMIRVQYVNQIKSYIVIPELDRKHDVTCNISLIRMVIILESIGVILKEQS